MTRTDDPPAQGYEDSYAHFDSPLMHSVRREAYGEDIGQHSWVSAGELRGDIGRLGLSAASRLLDLGCGPGGPLVFLAAACGCCGTGLDLSEAAIEAARRRAAAAGIEAKLAFLRADLNLSLPLPDELFDAAVSFDVVLHVTDRLALFREIARVLKRGGRLLFTDAGVLAGPISNDEIASRSLHGLTQLRPAGFNERALMETGFRLVAAEERTASLRHNASGRLEARDRHRRELIALEGPEGFERQQQYLRTVLGLAERGTLTRQMYLAQLRR